MPWKLYVDFKRVKLEVSCYEAGRLEDNKITRLPGKNQGEENLKLIWINQVMVEKNDT